MEGWVKLHRKLLEATIFQNPNLLKFWIWCLLKASHKEHKERVGLQEITLHSGQFVFGRNKAALELDMTPSTVYKYLKIMEKEQLITIESNNKFSVVSIVKWEFYQSEDKNCDSKVTQTRMKRMLRMKRKIYCARLMPTHCLNACGKHTRINGEKARCPMQRKRRSPRLVRRKCNGLWRGTSRN